MQTEDITITIKNIPSEPLQSVWTKSLDDFKRLTGATAQKTDNIVIDFADCSLDGFCSIMSSSLATYCVKHFANSIKNS